MSGSQPTYEESLTKIAELETKLTTLTTQFTAKKAEDDTEHKEMQTSFKKAQDEMKDKDKEREATHDDMEKVKDAFKKAEDETDPEKKKDAMKKAMDMKEEHESKGKKAEDAPKENIDKVKEHEASLNTLEGKFSEPLKLKILEATRAFDPQNLEKVALKMKSASLKEVEDHLETIKPFIAALGVGDNPTSVAESPTFIPFQASAVLPEGAGITDIKNASVDTIDWRNVKTSDIKGMYQ